MVKKFLDLIKVTSIMWICVLLPLVIGFFYIQSSSSKDVKKYMDSYLESESVNLDKYVSLQLKNTGKELVEISNTIIQSQLENSNVNLGKVCPDIIKNNSNITNISLYDTQGLVLYKTIEDDDETLDTSDYSIVDLKDKEVYYHFKQDDNGKVLINFIMKRDLKIENSNIKPFYLVVCMKWSQYENFIERIQDGVFARKYYIISPDCKRYISCNSLPQGEDTPRNVLALGLHLSKNIKNIKLGISDLELEKNIYRVFKSEIKSPERFEGSQLFIVATVDEGSFKDLSKRLFKNSVSTFWALLCILIVICLVISQYVNNAKNKLFISREISNSTPSAIIVFDAQTGKIEQINPSGLTLTRLINERVSEVNAWDLFVSEKDRNYIINAMKSDIHIVNYEVLVQSYAGNTFWAICSANPLEITSGIEKKISVVLSILDINKRKEIEKKLANNAELLEKQVAERTADLEIKAKELEASNKSLDQAKLQADNANAAKTKFLTNMSIELKTPLNAIIGYSEILQEEAKDRKDTVTAEDLAKIIRSAKHLLSLINEILDLSAIESGKTQLFFETISIVNLIKEVEGVSMPLITKNENSFYCEYSKDIGEMYVDQTKLRQCILNLIDNAAKFTEFGKITLKAYPLVKNSTDYIEFDVIDTGAGIPQDKIDTIFTSFKDDNSQAIGSGLGLSITSKYIECMGGTISVESEQGVGSKFIIQLPRISKVESSEFVEIKNKENEEEIDPYLDSFDISTESTALTTDSFKNDSTPD